MASNEIKILIGGDAQGIQKAALQASSSLTALQKSAIASSQALTKVPVGANQATNALTNLSRIAQDAPFGFIGITNNINPLLESFQRLKTETGSTGGALKALGSSLIGAGGLGLAVGIGSALLTVFGDKLFGIGRASQKAKDDAAELAKVLRSISSIESEASSGVQGQIAQVNALASAVSDTNKSYGERKRALEELQQINKSYFGTLTLEDAATGKLTSTVNEYTKALVNTAITKKFVEEIATVAKAASDADIELTKSTTKRLQAENELKKIQAENATRVSGASAVGTTLKEFNARKAVIAASEEQRQAGEKVTDILTQQALLTDRLNKSVGEGIKLKDLDKGSTDKQTDALKTRIAALKELQSISGLTQDQQIELAQLEIKLASRDAVKQGFTNEELQQQIQGIIDKAFPGQVEFEMNAKIKLKLDNSAIEKPDISKALGLDKIDTGKLDEAMERIRKQAAASARANLSGSEIGLAFAESIVNGLEQASSTIGEAFGSILSGEGIGQSLAKAAQGILSIIGSVLQDIGKQIIATSVAVQALKKALASLFSNPALALGAGLALIALGGVLKNIKFDLPKFQDGGITSGPSSGFPAILHPNEAIIPLNKLPDIVGRIKGGGNDITLAPVVSFGYDKLLIGLQRIESRRARLG